MKQVTINKIIIAYLVIATVLQYILKLGMNKSLFRYGFMWLSLYARFMFSCKLFGYISKFHLQIEAVAFVMSLILFFNLNASDTFIFNVKNIIIVILLELIILIIYKVESKYIYDYVREGDFNE